jgi:hypothetical protein
LGVINNFIEKNRDLIETWLKNIKEIKKHSSKKAWETLDTVFSEFGENRKRV